jgi:hypothetical protein
VQEDALHVLVVVGVAVSVVVVSMIVRVAVTVVCVAESCKAYNVHEEAEDTNNQELVKSLEFVTLPQSLKGIEDDLHADKSWSC